MISVANKYTHICRYVKTFPHKTVWNSMLFLNMESREYVEHKQLAFITKCVSLNSALIRRLKLLFSAVSNILFACNSCIRILSLTRLSITWLNCLAHQKIGDESDFHSKTQIYSITVLFPYNLILENHFDIF